MDLSVIEEVKAKLLKYPNIKYQIGDDYIRVFPVSEGGFEVGLMVLEGEYKVNFEGWYERFEDKDEALNCLAFGLTTKCRIKEYRRGNIDYKWTLESKENAQWVEQGTVSLIFFPFWRKKEIKYLQNTLIKEEGATLLQDS
jgi:hypothetical protein